MPGAPGPAFATWESSTLTSPRRKPALSLSKWIFAGRAAHAEGCSLERSPRRRQLAPPQVVQIISRNLLI